MHTILRVDSISQDGTMKMCTCLRPDNTMYSVELTTAEVDLYFRLKRIESETGCNRSVMVNALRADIEAYVTARLNQNVSQ